MILNFFINVNLIIDINMKYTFVILFISCTSFAQIDSAHTGLIYGEDHAFAVKAPSGWVLDNESGVSLGLMAVFYPLGSSWQKAISVMYTNTALKKIKGNETIQKVIDYDVNTFKNEQDAEVKNGSDLITSDNKTAIVKIFYDKKNKNYEAVAYIDEKYVVVMLVLSSRNKEDFENCYEAFEQFVKSYFYLTDNVKIHDK